MINGYRNLCAIGLSFQCNSHRFITLLPRAQVREKRSNLFTEEQKKVRSKVGRIEKIRVKYLSHDEEIIMLMNKDLSTPHDCAKHISEGITKCSALALVDGTPWDMHKPLVSDCEVKLLTMNTPSVPAVNFSFWRTCSLLLGSVIETSFKDDIDVHLHSFTWPNINSGSFVYDAELGVTDWTPTEAELRAISGSFVKIARQKLPVERLETNVETALKIFEDNPFKVEQIPSIAEKNEDKVVLYRIGDHVDISKGPMVANTGLIGKSTITAVHKFPSQDSDELYRFQGVAIPQGLIINHFAYSILEGRARKLNRTVWNPHTVQDEPEQKLAIAAKN